jgi:hypothetical protein
MPRGKTSETVLIINTTIEILTASRYPLTLRRIFYELVSKDVIENSQSSYTKLITKLTDARWDGGIPVPLLDMITDGTRVPLRTSSWKDIADFAETAAAIYQRDRWADQSSYVELWVEKQAIVSILEGVCSENQITLRSLHGFNSFTAIHQTAKDLLEIHKNITIFYLGDHDPHGYEIERDVQKRLFAMFDLLGSPVKRHAVDFRPRLGILKADIGNLEFFH